MRTVIALTAALLCSLIGSYMVWTYEGDTLDASKVTVYVANEGDVEQLAWSTDLSKVTLSMKSDEKGAYVWVESEQQIEVPQEPIIPPTPDESKEAETDADGGDETPAPVIEPEPVYETQKTAFVGGKQATDLVAKFTPLQAIRELPSESQLDMGMEEPFGTVSVTRKSGVLSLTVGKETFGGKQRFLSAESRHFLINKSDVRPFENADKLMEGRVHPLNRFSATRVEINAGEQSRVMEQQNAADKRKAYWADPSTPESKDESGETWVYKALDIKTKSYVQGEAPTNLEAVFTMKVSNSDENWTLEVHRTTGEDPVAYYGKSDFTRGWVALNAKAADAGEDLEAFLSGPATE